MHQFGVAHEIQNPFYDPFHEKNTAIILICHSSLIYPCNFWPLPGGLSHVLNVFKLVSCKPEARLQGAGSGWGPRPGLRTSTVSKLIFSYVIVVNRNKFNLIFE